jgi:hypothetical protein
MGRPDGPGPEWARCPERSGKYEYNWCNRHGWRRCEEMSRHAVKHPHGHKTGWCQACHTDGQLRRRYGFTPADVAALLATQQGVCAICATPDPGGNGTFCIDHDHSCCPGRESCGRCLRGALCHNCNRGIGCLKDSPDVLLAAVDYLRRYARSL